MGCQSNSRASRTCSSQNPGEPWEVGLEIQVKDQLNKIYQPQVKEKGKLVTYYHDLLVRDFLIL